MAASTSTFDTLDVVLQDYIVWRRRGTGQNLVFLHGVVESWLSAKTRSEDENTQFGTLFNPFELTSLKETLHSRILGELLDPQGSHGQGPAFLRRLLEHLKVPEPEAGEWRLTVEADRVDLMVARAKPASVILIENKANDAEDQPNQLYRYWYKQIYSRFPKLKYGSAEARQSFRVIYLSSDGKKKPEPQSLEQPADCLGVYHKLPLNCEPLGLDKLMTLLKEEADRCVPATNTRLKTFLEMYSESWNL